MRRQLSANSNGSNLGSIALLLKNLSVLQQKMKTTKATVIPTIDHSVNRTTAATQLLLSSIVANSHSKSLQFSHLFSSVPNTMHESSDPSTIALVNHLNSSSITSSKSSSTIINSPTIASPKLMSVMRNTSNDHMFSLSSMPKFDIDPKMMESANANEITEDTQKHMEYKNEEMKKGTVSQSTSVDDILSQFDIELLIMEKERLQKRKKHLQNLLLENNAKENNIQSKAEDIDEQWKLFQKCSERRLHCQQNRTYAMIDNTSAENMTQVHMPDMSPMEHFNTVADWYPMANEKKKNGVKVEIETQKRIICVLAVMQTAFAMFDKPQLLYKQLQNKACFYNKRIFATDSPQMMSMSVIKDCEMHDDDNECRLKIKVETEDDSAMNELEMDLSTNIIGQQTYDQRREIIRQSLSTFTLTSKSHQELLSKFISKNPNLKFDACNHIIFPALIKICP